MPLFGGSAPGQGFDFAQLLAALGATLQDVGAAEYGRPGGNIASFMAERKRLGDQRKYQDSLGAMFGTPEVNTVASTPLAPAAAAATGQPNDIAGRMAAQDNNRQSMMFSGPMGQSLGFDQSNAMLPLLQNMDPDMGLPVLLSAMGQAQERKDRKTERYEDRGFQVQDRAEARAQTVQDNAVRPATPEEKLLFGFSPQTPLFMDGFGKPIPVQDPNAITPLQQKQLGIQQAQLGLQRQQLAASQAQAGDAALGRQLANAKAMSELQDKAKSREGQAASYDVAIRTLDRLPDHPGFAGAVGMGFEKGIRALTPWVDRNDVTPGTSRADFMAELDAFKSQTFLPMVQSLRGMGALSNAEGERLTNAVGALNPDMSEKAFRDSVSRIKADLEAARLRSGGSFNAAPQQPANAPTQQGQPGRVRKYNPATGRIE